MDNGFWRFVHDLRQGGAIAQLHFLQSCSGNFLSQPIELRCGQFRALNEKSPRVSVCRRPGRVTIEAEGRLTTSRGAPGPRYKTAYEYRNACLRVRQTLSGVEGATTSSIVRLGKDCRWLGVGAPVFLSPLEKLWYDLAADGELPKMADVPYSWGGYSDQGFGVQFLVASIPGWWRGASRFHVEKTADGVAATTSHRARGTLTWETAVAPTNFGRGEAYRYRQATICSQPFPSDTELRQLARLGVNLLCIHEGANWKNTSEDFWADGMDPPYPGPNLRELKRVIATCHRLGMKIIAYFCFCEVHPLSTAFRRHGPEWYQKFGPDYYMRWSHPGTDQLWGGLMCTASGWGRWLTRHITRILDEYGLDGVYLDGAGSTGVCWHPGHGGGIPHSTFNGHQGILESLRRRFPDKILAMHQVSYGFNVAQQNMADHVVTFEEFDRDRLPTAADLPISMRVVSSCAPTAIVPGIFGARGGVPLSPMLCYFSYQPGKEPIPTRERLRRGIPAFLLNGNIPYTYYFNEALMWDYQNDKDRRTDRIGIYALYRRLTRLGDTSGRFLPWYRCPYRANKPGVGVAAIEQRRRTLLVVVNESNRRMAGVRVNGPGQPPRNAGVLGPFEYRFLEIPQRPAS